MPHATLIRLIFPMRAAPLAIGIMLVAAFAIGFLLRFDFLSILTIIWAALLGYWLPFRKAAIITAGVILCWFSMMSMLNQHLMWVHALLYGTFHMFALLLATSNRREKETSLELQTKNNQLLAMQHLLTEASRQSERTRIARDLHDVLGHHLTALTIKLQVASRITDGDARTQVEECHDLAKLLLSDVREAVGSLRDSAPLDFEYAIRLLVQHVPKVQIQLDLDKAMTIENMPTAQTLFRCIQEAITNCLKHSGAAKMWISINQTDNTIRTTIYDDGQLKPGWQKGNGLTGMQERVKERDGTLTLADKDNALCYTITLPI